MFNLVSSSPLKSEIFLVCFLDGENFISPRDNSERCRLRFFLWGCTLPLAIGTSLLQTSASVKVTAELELALAVGELVGGGAISNSDPSIGTRRKVSVFAVAATDVFLGSDIESFDLTSVVAISMSS